MRGRETERCTEWLWVIDSNLNAFWGQSENATTYYNMTFILRKQLCPQAALLLFECVSLSFFPLSASALNDWPWCRAVIRQRLDRDLSSACQNPIHHLSITSSTAACVIADDRRHVIGCTCRRWTGGSRYTRNQSECWCWSFQRSLLFLGICFSWIAN